MLRKYDAHAPHKASAFCFRLLYRAFLLLIGGIFLRVKQLFFLRDNCVHRGRLFRPNQGLQLLRVDEVSVDSTVEHQFSVRTLFRARPILHHHNIVGAADCRQAVSYHDRRAILRNTIQGGLDNFLATNIDGTSRLVKNQDRRLANDASSDGKPLALPAAQIDATFADSCGIPLVSC